MEIAALCLSLYKQEHDAAIFLRIRLQIIAYLFVYEP